MLAAHALEQLFCGGMVFCSREFFDQSEPRGRELEACRFGSLRVFFNKFHDHASFCCLPITLNLAREDLPHENFVTRSMKPFIQSEVGAEGTPRANKLMG